MLWDAGNNVLEDGAKGRCPRPIWLLMRSLLHFVAIFVPYGPMTTIVTIDPGGLDLLKLADDLASKRSVSRLRKPPHRPKCWAGRPAFPGFGIFGTGNLFLLGFVQLRVAYRKAQKSPASLTTIGYIRWSTNAQGYALRVWICANSSGGFCATCGRLEN
jgi:hypothetical protein